MISTTVSLRVELTIAPEKFRLETMREQLGIFQQLTGK
jgi:hypothetical protein